jgi:SAM-dependent methyltransferase
MLITLTCHAAAAPEIGYLFGKHPDSVFARPFSAGQVWVFYPEVAADRLSVTLVAEIDPIGLVRGPAALAGLDQYVNDRPYVASSLTGVALNVAFRSTMNGAVHEHAARLAERLRWEVELPVVACDGGAELIARVFAPLGYTVTTTRLPLDERFPAWGLSDLYAVRLEGEQTIGDVLGHLYVLLPVLDNAKHYAVDAAEAAKLLERGSAWLAAHPERELIARRYLRYRRPLVASALARLAESEPAAAEPAPEEEGDAAAAGMAADERADAADITERPLAVEEESPGEATDVALAGAAPTPDQPANQEVAPARVSEPPPIGAPAPDAADGAPGAPDPPRPAGEGSGVRSTLGLHEQRLDAVMAAVREAGAHSLADLGCGEGRLLSLALREPALTRILGLDVSTLALARARRRLRLDALPPSQRRRIEVAQGSLLYRDRRLEGFDAAALVEVIEHLDPPRLEAMERVVFEHARPRRVVVTTPNREYNVRWESLGEALRHRDHRFEWTRAECLAWAERVAARHGYTAARRDVGPADPELGAPSQLVTFDRI